MCGDFTWRVVRLWRISVDYSQEMMWLNLRALLVCVVVISFSLFHRQQQKGFPERTWQWALTDYLGADSGGRNRVINTNYFFGQVISIGYIVNHKVVSCTHRELKLLLSICRILHQKISTRFCFCCPTKSVSNPERLTPPMVALPVSAEFVFNIEAVVELTSIV